MIDKLLTTAVLLAVCAGTPGAFIACDPVGIAGIEGEGALSSPAGVTVGFGGKVYVADEGNNRVVVFDSAGAYVSRIGFAGSSQGRFLDPVDVAVEGRFLYVLEDGNERVQVFDRYEVSQGIILSRDEGDVDIPVAMAVDRFGRIYLSDIEVDQVRIFRSYTGDAEMILGGYGVDEGRFRYPAGIDVDRERKIYVCDRDNARVQVFDPLGGFLEVIGDAAGDGRLVRPAAVAVDLNGRLYVADIDRNAVIVYAPGGEFAGVIDRFSDGSPLRAPSGVAVGDTGLLYISDTGNDRLVIFRCGDPGHGR